MICSVHIYGFYIIKSTCRFNPKHAPLLLLEIILVTDSFNQSSGLFTFLYQIASCYNLICFAKKISKPNLTSSSMAL